jgi:hypothetical protein
MARNWKKAYEGMAQKAVGLSNALIDVQRDLGREQAARQEAEQKAASACRHMQAAADSLVTRGATDTAVLLRLEADRLWPYKATAVTKSADTDELAKR